MTRLDQTAPRGGPHPDPREPPHHQNTFGEPVWQRIRLGMAPDRSSISAVARSGLATLGTLGVTAADDALRSRLLGAGPLDDLLRDLDVTDIALNGDGSVWVDRGRGMERVEAEVGDPSERRALAVRLAGLAGRRLDDTSPYVDGQLPSGVRLHAILPPLVAGGPHITLRVPARIGLSALGARSMFPPAWQDLLVALVRRRVAFVVTGGTGAGKTTLLARCWPRRPPTSGSWWSRTSASCGSSIRTSSGSRPTRQRRGHRRSHADDADAPGAADAARSFGPRRGARGRGPRPDGGAQHRSRGGLRHPPRQRGARRVARFEALGALAGMEPVAVHAQLGTAVRVVVHVRRLSGGRRRLETVAVLRRGTGGAPYAVPALTWDGVTPCAGSGWPELAELLGHEPAQVSAW